MRLFVAIDIPDEIKERLRLFVERLRPLAKIAWSPVQNLHITTKFIGEWPENRLVEMKRVLAEMPAHSPIDISIRNLGWFPSETKPRVFWAGVASNRNEAGNSLATLAEKTDEATVRLGVAREQRAYSPHLTLARIRDTVALDVLRRAIQSENSEFGAFQAREFCLNVSSGGKYTQLAAFPLRAS